MLDICLKNKIISDFLKHYKQKKWNNIIPSLLEIAILNLYSSFKRYIFSEEDLSLIIENLKSKYFQPLQIKKNFKKLINNAREKINIDIPKFRKNLKLNLQDYLQGRNESYRSFTKKPKNINELNIYNNNKDNKNNHYYNRSSVVTPMKGLINYNETDDVSVNENRYKNIFKINKLNKRIKKNNFKFNNEKKIIEYNTIDHYDYINETYQNIFNNSKNINMNYSYSIDYKKNKKYIKVNKNDNSNNKVIEKNIYNDEEKKKKKDNKYYSHKEINDKTNKINKIAKLKIINDYKKKYKNNYNLLPNFNKEQILKLDENKNKNLNTIYYNKEKRYTQNSSKTVNNSMIIHNSPKKNIELKGISKLQKYINNHHQLNINKNNKKEFKNIQLTSIKKNLKNIILNRDKKRDYYSNKNLIEEINKSIPSINDINMSYSLCNNNNLLKINEQAAFLLKNNNRKKIINYNSFNSDKNSKNSIFLNDPYLFAKSPGIKKFILGKKLNNINTNGKDNNN